ncbi:hypothetical protein ACP4OV_002298 [Aristida adscensionis]
MPCSARSTWRPLWRSAPLNLDQCARYPPRARGIPVRDLPRILAVHAGPGRRFRIPERHLDVRDLPRILAAHAGPGRRFCIPERYLEGIDRPTEVLDGWLRSPTLDNLQELEIHVGSWSKPPPLPPLPASALRFSSTLRVATFGVCTFPDGDNGMGTAPRLPLLEKLTLKDITISESFLNALLAGCSAMEALVLRRVRGCSRARIVSSSLRCIVASLSGGRLPLHHLTIEDAPCLERLLLSNNYVVDACISVVSAPRLETRDPSSLPQTRVWHYDFSGGSRSVKVLALHYANLDMVINVLKCFFPCLEKLYIKDIMEKETNAWCHKYRHLIGTLDIHLRKVVLRCYRANKSDVNIAMFFVLNARSLVSMILGLEPAKFRDAAWIGRQHRLLQIEKRAAESA